MGHHNGKSLFFRKTPSPNRSALVSWLLVGGGRLRRRTSARGEAAGFAALLASRTVCADVAPRPVSRAGQYVDSAFVVATLRYATLRPRSRSVVARRRRSGVVQIPTAAIEKVHSVSRRRARCTSPTALDGSFLNPWQRARGCAAGCCAKERTQGSRVEAQPRHARTHHPVHLSELLWLAAA